MADVAIDAVPVDRTLSTVRRLGFGFWLSVGFLVLVVLLAVLAPILPIEDPTRTAVGGRFEGPRPGLWFGADGNFTQSETGNKIGATAYYGDHCGFSVHACSDPVQKASSGDKAWAYIITDWTGRDDGIGPCLIMLMSVVNRQG